MVPSFVLSTYNRIAVYRFIETRPSLNMGSFDTV